MSDVRMVNRYTGWVVYARPGVSQRLRRCENCNRTIERGDAQFYVKGFVPYWLCDRCGAAAIKALVLERCQAWIRPRRRRTT